MSFHDNSATESMPPEHHYSSYDEGSSGDGGDFFDNHPFLEAVFCYGWLFLLFYCLICRNTREPPSTEIGDRIRARARAAQETIQQKQIKEELSPAERKHVVDENMITKVVLSKDEDGNLTLGTVGTEASEDVESQEQAYDEGGNNKNITHLAADDDEGATCVICLDCFEPDDLVSWTKHDPTCTHVFHDECIRQWLEERRQDECPSCRCNLVPPVEVPKCKSLEDDEEENEDTDEEQAQVEESDSDTDAPSGRREAKEDGESVLFTVMSGLLSRATSRTRRPPSAPRSGEYNLVSVNSGSFDSQEAPEQVQDPEVALQPSLESSPSSSSSSSSSDDDDDVEEESNPLQLLSSIDSSTTLASVETMSISEALRQSEAMEDDDDEDEEMGGAKTGAMELGMDDAVSDIVFSP